MTHIEPENIDIDFIKKLALDLIDPEQVLLSAVSTTNISHDCIESIKFITSVHQADIRKLQCKCTSTISLNCKMFNIF